MHTEEEAKKLICPKLAIAFKAKKKCIASSCMMWRWGDEVGLVEGDKEWTKGFCGLGGKP